MAVCRILQLGDPLLREVSGAVDWRAALPVIENLRDTLHDFQQRQGFGRGIAAVQIGATVRVIYIEIDGCAYSLINPFMSRHSEERFALWDDCFSFPDLLVRVERFARVTVDYTDEHGAAKCIDAAGPFSELLQHELDHLDGVLAIDRAIDANSICTRAEYDRQHNAR